MDSAAAKELEALARRMIWWKAPDEALQHPGRLLAQVMALGTWEDVQLAKRLWPKEKFLAILANAPAGVFDRRSWVYWHTILGLPSVPPLPKRQLP